MSLAWQQCLHFRPLPHGQGSLRPTFFVAMTAPPVPLTPTAPIRPGARSYTGGLKKVTSDLAWGPSPGRPGGARKMELNRYHFVVCADMIARAAAGAILVAEHATVSLAKFGLSRARQREKIMAKGQMRSNREAKKPKSDKPKNSVSEYKKSQGKGAQVLGPPGKKS